MSDARFEDGGEQPLRLTAATADDLAVISALAQDAVCKVERVQWMARRRRFAMLLYRFRWEDRADAEKEKRTYERVASAFTIDDVSVVKSHGISATDRDAVFNVLSIGFTPAEDGAGVLTIECSGNAAFALDVECLNVSLVDLTRPWSAGGRPDHS
ncbi:MAG: DUF2948 family protein [Pikeienuella sp.]